MKKILLFVTVLFYSLSVFADEKQEIVFIPTISGPIKQPRSVTVAPKAEINFMTWTLTVSMVSSDSFTMYVYDECGGVVYQGSVVSDGGRHPYILPKLESGLYSITIDGQSASYEGEFFAN